MKLDELFNITNFGESSPLSVLVDTEEGPVSLSAVNLSGGVCDCCTELHNTEDLDVIRIVNLENMEVIYEKGKGPTHS